MHPKHATIEFYNQNAKNYALQKPDASFLAKRETFISKLKPGAKILDLGSGGGHDALAFLNLGFDVTLVDISPKLAAQAEVRTKKNVLLIDFEDIDFKIRFDAVWAAASLLHVPSDKLTKVFKLVFNSLQPSGIFTSSFKQNPTDWIDKFGRYFCAMDHTRLASILENTGFTIGSISTENGIGSDMKPTNWLWATVYKPT